MSDQRYVRQLLIENWDQNKLNESTATIIGLGALGTVAAASLAMAGVSTLILVDYDTIEMSNLNRQLFYRPLDVGSTKVEICEKILKNINPNIDIKPFNRHIEKVPHHELESSTVILEGLDTFQTRRWVNSFCAAKKVPLVSGGMYSFLGNIQVIIPEKSPCLECQSLIPEEELQKACTPFGEIRKKERSQEIQDEIIPSVSSVSFVIGGLMAQEALKIIMKLPPLKEYLFWDGRAGIFTSVPLKRRDDCIVCSPKFKLKAILIRSPKDQSIKDFGTQLRYSFNLSSDMFMLYKTKKLSLSKKRVGKVFSEDAIFRVIDPSLSFPLKFQILLD